MALLKMKGYFLMNFWLFIGISFPAHFTISLFFEEREAELLEADEQYKQVLKSIFTSFLELQHIEQQKQIFPLLAPNVGNIHEHPIAPVWKSGWLFKLGHDVLSWNKRWCHCRLHLRINCLKVSFGE